MIMMHLQDPVNTSLKSEAQIAANHCKVTPLLGMKDYW